MYELITEKTLAEYEAFISSHPKGALCPVQSLGQAEGCLDLAGGGRPGAGWANLWYGGLPHPENAPVWREYAVRLPGTGVQPRGPGDLLPP